MNNLQSILKPLCAAVALLSINSAAMAQTGARPKPKAAAKPAPKAAVKPAPKPTAQGMTQMAGDNGQLGVTYTIGAQDPINFTLNSAEFRVARVVIDGNVTAPRAGEKLLVLNFTVHNPNKTVRHFDWGTLAFTAVNPASENFEYAQAVGRAGTTETLAIDLKPAQKVDGYTMIVVPAKGIFPKLIVTPSSGGAVLRYDLRGKVKALAAPFADAADSTTARTDVPAELKTFYPGANFDLKLDSVSYTPGPIGSFEKEDGKRFVVLNVTLRNATTVPQHYDSGTLLPGLVDSDGEKVEWNQTLFKTKRDDNAEGELKPGEEYTARYFFQLPENVSAKSFTIAEGESRAYTFDVSNIK